MARTQPCREQVTMVALRPPLPERGKGITNLHQIYLATSGSVLPVFSFARAWETRLLSCWAVRMPVHLGAENGRRSGEVVGNKDGQQYVIR